MATPINNISNTGLLSTTDVATKQDTCDSHKAEATCFNKSVESVKPPVSIKIDKSKKRHVIRNPPNQVDLQNRSVLKYFPFEIDGTVFNCINGNERDNELAAKLIDMSDDCPKKSISFSIKTQDGEHEFKPPRLWQERLLRCINEGLQNIFDDCPPEFVPVSENNTMDEFRKDKKIPTTCLQFVNFMEFNSHSFNDRVRLDRAPLNESDIKNQFTPMSISTSKNNKLVHVFIHIGDNVCIGKMGHNEICFHAPEDVLNFYQAYSETPMILEVVNKILTSPKLHST
ncbi:hypothetical protein [Endozoicomonas sp. 4G]|uniref:hypothetical protein n=1 Tax=Endozoicomonas sp. 4G TaxID=2872754 RepID=UPI002078D6D0|nr:hypothetical protein [Endozoicomonas sp. 4G]